MPNPCAPNSLLFIGNFQEECKSDLISPWPLSTNMGCGAMDEAVSSLTRGRMNSGYGENSIGSVATLMNPVTRNSNYSKLQCGHRTPNEKKKKSCFPRNIFQTNTITKTQITLK